ncbi:hypothetical protein BDN71DRAFT_1505307 [Pleurotus eryngii]|uniref:Uncharacterized protein n=1 Tax=Pleurotus eryngii TaxID=5323 RepID=A0A9P6A4I4_PLEER|nr:hypothetical protein BDN71DRAFT_1505307 [Pleurotus eryngii]
MSIAKPVAKAGVVEHAGPDVAAVLTSLKAESNSVLPQIKALIDSNNGSIDNIELLFHHLVDTFETTTALLTNQKGTVFTPQSGPTKVEATAIIVSIVTDIVTTLKKFPVEGRILLLTILSVLNLVMKDFLLSMEEILDDTLVLLMGL